MERSSTTRPPQDQEHSAGELVKMMSEQVSALIRNELKLAQVEMTSKGKQAALGAGMFGASGVVAAWLAALIVGVALLAVAGCAALVGKRRLQTATPPVPAETVASVKADVDEIKERVHR